MADFTLGTNIEGMQDCLVFLAAAIRKYGDNGVVRLENELFSSMEGENRVMVSVDGAADLITLTFKEVKE